MPEVKKPQDSAAAEPAAPSAGNEQMLQALKQMEERIIAAEAKAAEASAGADALKKQLAEQAAKIAEQAAKIEEQGQLLGEATLSVEEAAVIVQAEALAQGDVRNDKRVKIVIANGEGAAGRQAVYANVNGMEYYIPRDKEVEIPACVLEALNNATQTEYDMGEGKPSDPREVPRLNIRVVG